ncbi:hypothetical protein D0Z70_08610 [Sphingobium terrigena]|uniref:Uncharacterized protein n=1 Tax=Sphingobium terrigena TaxID=2304063 RepID=A0A418YTS1_9SPHN|nr:hypothetical protein [Sphingobium terrigena]RJG55457.1 hypothetical protein D0Z70_08610 [Sphingobium terrigena]
MNVKGSFAIWWKPLPLWLKLATVLIAYPAWALIVYCIVSGTAKGALSLWAVGAFGLVVLLHIMFDSRNRKKGIEHLGGLELHGGDD